MICCVWWLKWSTLIPWVQCKTPSAVFNVLFLKLICIDCQKWSPKFFPPCSFTDFFQNGTLQEHIFFLLKWSVLMHNNLHTKNPSPFWSIFLKKIKKTEGKKGNFLLESFRQSMLIYSKTVHQKNMGGFALYTVHKCSSLEPSSSNATSRWL